MLDKNYVSLKNNSGFSLVEVIIAVAILSVIVAPLLKSFSTAAKANFRAQGLQDATSLAESVMEEVKGNSIEELYKSSLTRPEMTFSVIDPGGSLIPGEISDTKIDAPPYIISYTDVTATQNRKYDATVTISRDEYAKEGTAESPISGISDANIKPLPKLSSINSEEHAVLSWEINEYDDSAIDRLAEENLKADSEKTAFINLAKNSGKKETIVSIDDGGSSDVKVTCNVEYTTGNSSDKPIKLLVYTGYFKDNSASSIGGPNVYLFYSVSEKNPNVTDGKYFKNETITVRDNTSGKRHNVYLILQDNMNRLSTSGGTKVSVNVLGTAYENPVSLISTDSISSSYFTLSKGVDNTEGTEDDVKLYTNLVNTENEDGILYDTVIKDRIYYVTTEIKEHGKDEVIAKLNTTMNAGKEADR